MLEYSDVLLESEHAESVMPVYSAAGREGIERYNALVDMNYSRCLLALLVTLAMIACGEKPTPAPAPDPTPPPVPAASASPPAEDVRPLVVFLGDSLTAGLGLGESQAFPARVAARLREAGHALRVVNAGVSGDTTAGGLERLDWLLRQEPDVLVVALGANDGLRGLPLEMSEANLRQIIERARAAGARVLLAGMLIPPNYGPDYAESFAALFPRLAAELDVPLIPFLLADVAAVPELNLADGIHPNAAGQEKVAATVAPYVARLLDEQTADGEAGSE